FQPWVINGVVEPPANPLTISQTCVRFNDIDNVGKTGRHFTMFEMIAHHAFNKKDSFIYFKDRTVELCHELFTKELGIDENEPTYIEEWWEGGGNSGPCFEAIVRGVELATLVFMMYEETAQGRKNLPMQVVDTGYGLERFAWVSQGVPNAYEAVFPQLGGKLKQMLRLDVDMHILKRYSALCSKADVHSQGAIRAVKEELSIELKMDFEHLSSLLRPFEQIYTILDHTRGLMFLLNDGVVPSNVKDGYFARLLARRAMRAMDLLELDASLSDVVGWQIEEYSNYFPELGKNRETILQLSRVEEAKFERAMEKGKAMVERIEKEGRLDLEAMIELYDSHGMDPETVSQCAKSPPVIPDNFYALVAQRHENPLDENKTTTREIPGGSTELLYYQDDTVQSFQAKVTAVLEEGVVLDKTAFYPEGGGQETDYGTINEFKVSFVEKAGTAVLHHITGEWKFSVGEVVTGIVDWERRKQLTRQHTATHIINAAARKVLGKHVMQTGAHKSEEIARLDITHYEGISHEDLRKIERIANDIVLENREISQSVLPRDEAEGKYGYTLYQGGAVPGRDIRVVNITDWDVEACGGTHLHNTGEVGFIKLLRAKRIQDGVVRLEFTSGSSAVSTVQELDRSVETMAKSLGSPKGDVPKALLSLLTEHEMIKEELKELKRGAINNAAKDLSNEGKTVSGINLI
ncbi:MAG TPA: alanine--tRNA ligase, partial [Euryarchaeota archaeon]|nr:alanine--tRNA ligase [Euryarchaeota archaeon]